jgi:hypothetical protein
MIKQINDLEVNLKNKKNIQDGVKVATEKNTQTLTVQKAVSSPPISMNSNPKNGGFRFLPSEKCNSQYPNYTGASVSGNRMLCGNEKIEDAKLSPILKGGKIISVDVSKSGKGYVSVPKIMVKGDGKHAKLEAIIKDGKIVDVKIIDGGMDYYDTPEIIIESTYSNSTCYLCSS